MQKWEYLEVVFQDEFVEEENLPNKVDLENIDRYIRWAVYKNGSKSNLESPETRFAILNQLGEDGWELVFYDESNRSIDYSGVNVLKYIFKRPVL